MALTADRTGDIYEGAIQGQAKVPVAAATTIFMGGWYTSTLQTNPGLQRAGVAR